MDKNAGILGGLHQVLGPSQLKTADLGKLLNHQSGITWRTVYACTNGCCPHVNIPECLGCLFDRIDGAVNHNRIGAEFLPQGHGNGILIFSASHLQYVFKRFSLSFQRIAQFFHCVDQIFFGEQYRQFYRCWVDVIGGLGAINMIIGMQILILAFIITQDFQTAIGNHFVGVHIGGGAGTALKHVNGELVVQFAVQNFITGLGYGFHPGLINPAQFMIGHGRSLFDHGQRFDHVFKIIDMYAGDGKIFHGALGLHAIIYIIGNVTCSQGVMFQAKSACDRVISFLVLKKFIVKYAHASINADCNPGNDSVKKIGLSFSKCINFFP